MPDWQHRERGKSSNVSQKKKKNLMFLFTLSDVWYNGFEISSKYNSGKNECFAAYSSL